MTNAELIKALRRCSYTTVAGADREDGYCKPCVYYTEDSVDVTCIDRMMIDAADALEAADEKIADYTAAIDALDDSNDAYIKERERLKKRIAELEAHSQKWTMLKDEMPKPHTKVLVSGIEAINNSRVYKVMVNDNGTLRPTDYAPSIRWDYWMPFGSPDCGAKMNMKKGKQE